MRIVTSVSARAINEKHAPTKPALVMPGPATTAEPTAVPKLMPMLNAVGSTELASIMALGWRWRATRMNMEMHGTESTYMEMPIPKITSSVAGMAPASRYSANNSPACTRKTGTRPFMPTRASTMPDSMFEMMHMTPYAMSAPDACSALSPATCSRNGVMNA